VGLREGLAILHAQLHQWPEHIHPQAQIDGQPDPDGPLVREFAGETRFFVARKA
jgi:predicted component of type VI protein secretion system